MRRSGIGRKVGSRPRLIANLASRHSSTRPLGAIDAAEMAPKILARAERYGDAAADLIVVENWVADHPGQTAIQKNTELFDPSRSGTRRMVGPTIAPRDDRDVRSACRGCAAHFVRAAASRSDGRPLGFAAPPLQGPALWAAVREDGICEDLDRAGACAGARVRMAHSATHDGIGGSAWPSCSSPLWR